MWHFLTLLLGLAHAIGTPTSTSSSSSTATAPRSESSSSSSTASSSGQGRGGAGAARRLQATQTASSSGTFTSRVSSSKSSRQSLTRTATSSRSAFTTSATATSSPSAAAWPCPGGFFCPLGGDPANGVLPCAPGSWSAAGYNTQCTPCTAGTFAATAAATSCRRCPAGRFCPPGTRSWARATCGRGFYCPDGATAPIPCPIQAAPAGGWPAGAQGPAFLGAFASSPLALATPQTSAKQYLARTGGNLSLRAILSPQRTPFTPPSTTPTPFCSGQCWVPGAMLL
jgi:hypothetical protein